MAEHLSDVDIEELSNILEVARQNKALSLALNWIDQNTCKVLLFSDKEAKEELEKQRFYLIDYFKIKKFENHLGDFATIMNDCANYRGLRAEERERVELGGERLFHLPSDVFVDRISSPELIDFIHLLISIYSPQEHYKSLIWQYGYLSISLNADDPYFDVCLNFLEEILERAKTDHWINFFTTKIDLFILKLNGLLSREDLGNYKNQMARILEFIDSCDTHENEDLSHYLQQMIFECLRSDVLEGANQSDDGLQKFQSDGIWKDRFTWFPMSIRNLRVLKFAPSVPVQGKSFGQLFGIFLKIITHFFTPRGWFIVSGIILFGALGSFLFRDALESGLMNNQISRLFNDRNQNSSGGASPSILRAAHLAPNILLFSLNIQPRKSEDLIKILEQSQQAVEKSQQSFEVAQNSAEIKQLMSESYQSLAETQQLMAETNQMASEKNQQQAKAEQWLSEAQKWRHIASSWGTLSKTENDEAQRYLSEAKKSLQRTQQYTLAMRSTHSNDEQIVKYQNSSVVQASLPITFSSLSRPPYLDDSNRLHKIIEITATTVAAISLGVVIGLRYRHNRKASKFE